MHVDSKPLDTTSFEECLADLSRLVDGWSGPGSLSLRFEVLRDVRLAVTSIPNGAAIPAFEIDPGDGTLAMVWADRSTAFSLVVNGNGTVIGIVSPATADRPAWRVDLADPHVMRQRLADPALGRFLAHRPRANA